MSNEELDPSDSIWQDELDKQLVELLGETDGDYLSEEEDPSGNQGETEEDEANSTDNDENPLVDTSQDIKDDDFLAEEEDSTGNRGETEEVEANSTYNDENSCLDTSQEIKDDHPLSEEEPTGTHGGTKKVEANTIDNNENKYVNKGGKIEKEIMQDPVREQLLSILEDNLEPEMSVEDMLEQIYDEKKKEERKRGENINSPLNEATSSNSDMLHVAERVLEIGDNPCVKVEKGPIGRKPVTRDDKNKNQTKHKGFNGLDAQSSSIRPQDQIEKEIDPVSGVEEGEVIDDDSKIPAKKIESIEQESIFLINPAISQADAAVFGLKGLPSQALFSSLVTSGYHISKMAKSINKLTEYVSKNKYKKKSNKKKYEHTSKTRKFKKSNPSTSLMPRSRSRSPSKSSSSSKFSSSSRFSSSSKTSSSSRFSPSLSSSSSSRSRSRSISVSSQQKTKHKSFLKQQYIPKQYRSHSKFRSRSSHKRNYCSNRSRSRSYSKSPQRSNSKLSSKPKSKVIIMNSDDRIRSPSSSPTLRKRRFSNSSSSSTHTSSSPSIRCVSSRSKSRSRSNTPKQQRRISYRNRSKSRSHTPKQRRRRSSRSKSRSRSRMPKRRKRRSSRSESRSRSYTSKKPYTPHSTSLSDMLAGNRPSTSQQSYVAHQVYQQQICQGYNIMTRKATVTTSYKEELKSFKKSLSSDSLQGCVSDDPCELSKLEITVFNTKGEDVTFERPDGNLNHSLYIHPEDAELYRMKCKNGLQPLQALHEICVKCNWLLPHYMLLPTHKGFRFGMEIQGYRFVTEKTAQQKKVAKAAAALTVLQWLKIVDIV